MTGFHANKPLRSTSLPSGSHPLLSQIHLELNTLKSLLEPVSPPRANAVQSTFASLVHLHESMENFLQLPLTQQAITSLQEEKGMEATLDNYVKLLDACTVMRDTLLLTKEQSWAMHSALRRRGAALAGEADAYLRSRKKPIKDAQRSIKALRQLDEKNSNISYTDKNLSEVAEVLTAITAVSADSFRLFFSFLSSKRSMVKLRPSGWSIVSRAILKGVMGQENCEETMNELESANAAVCMIQKHQSSKEVSAESVQEAQMRLLKQELCIDELQVLAESVYRRIIQSRVSLLNILTK